MGKIKYPNLYEIYEDHATLEITSEKFGKFIIKIDINDVERCRQIHWCMSRTKSTSGYYYMYCRNKDGLLLHRFITNAEKWMFVDHINHDTLDNRKSNLFAGSPQENLRNTRTQTNNKLGVKGVCIHKPTGKYMVYICCDRKTITVGYFDNLDDAVEARRLAEIKYFGREIGL